MSIYNFIGFAFFLGLVFILLGNTLFSCGVGLFNSYTLDTELFLFDSLSYYLIILVFLLGCLSIFMLNSYLSGSVVFFLVLSLLFSCLCFCVNHSVLFWCFYELSMLPLLYLIFKESPYSERFVAGWYFSVYLLVTSLPLILCLLYLSVVNGSFLFTHWGPLSCPVILYVFLSFIFFTKVPLGPFHTWLPIVHAEATSIVSIFLSGYIMKLGLLGVYRCASSIFNSNMYLYLFLCLILSICFAVTASSELDGKRWLAFLSLSHIVIGFLSFYIGTWEGISLGFIFCLGHGLSAGLVFGVLWLFYDVTASRNWLLLKEGLTGKCLLFSLVISLLSLCSFPPTLQFFCEVNLLAESTWCSVFLLFWCLYLFIGGLVPLVLCGSCVIRTEAVEFSCYNFYIFFMYFFALSIWCFCGIFLL
uniref:NADH-ubiquinone oxidoreductase chain 4 n=1 Tax=Rhinebothriidae sp. DJM-2021 TaxID=2899516 RepID=A0A8K1SWV6_9CEST|nr:NADH dehydrogenase subunit 4 [Rhinebothriidae sp. DJM-2021]